MSVSARQIFSNVTRRALAYAGKMIFRRTCPPWDLAGVLNTDGCSPDALCNCLPFLLDKPGSVTVSIAGVSLCGTCGPQPGGAGNQKVTSLNINGTYTLTFLDPNNGEGDGTMAGIGSDVCGWVCKIPGAMTYQQYAGANCTGGVTETVTIDLWVWIGGSSATGVTGNNEIYAAAAKNNHCRIVVVANTPGDPYVIPAFFGELDSDAKAVLQCVGAVTVPNLNAAAYPCDGSGGGTPMGTGGTATVSYP